VYLQYLSPLKNWCSPPSPKERGLVKDFYLIRLRERGKRTGSIVTRDYKKPLQLYSLRVISSSKIREPSQLRTKQGGIDHYQGLKFPKNRLTGKERAGS